MKRFLCGLICLTLLLSAVPALAVGVTDVMIVANCSEWVSLRESPDTASKRLKTVRLGEFVTDCTMATNGFVHCCYEGVWGYILFQYLQPTNYSSAEGFVGNQMVVNCKDWVSMRESPDNTSKRVAQVPLGTVVTGCLAYYAGDFIYCRYNGREGYISSTYLRSAYYDALKKNEKVVSDAAGKYPAIVGQMQVVNCKEWVSLRVRASDASSRITKVSLGEYVDNCVQVSDQFVYCRYKTLWGYIQIQYLQGRQATVAPTVTPVVTPTMVPVVTPYIPGFTPTPVPGGNDGEVESIFAWMDRPSYNLLSQLGTGVVDYTAENDYTILVRRAYGQREELVAVCYDPDLRPLWQTGVMAGSEMGNELQTAAFVAGTSGAPQIVLYEVEEGFTAYGVGPWTGVLWQTPNTVAQAGGSICAITDEDGRIYVAFEGKLLSLSPAGAVLWRMEYPDERIARPFEINIRNGYLEVYYDTDVEHANLCWRATYSRNGQLLMLSSVENP